MARSTTTNPRLDTTVTDAPTIQLAHRLMDAFGVGNADLYRNALTLFEWCARQVQEGRHIASINESGDVARELALPLLEAARPHGRLVLHPEAFDRVVELVERPATPTPTLQALMAETHARRRVPTPG